MDRVQRLRDINTKTRIQPLRPGTFADGQYYDYQAWSSFRSGYLRRALTEASPALKHLSLKWRVDYTQCPELDENPMSIHIPLQTILPPLDKWENLRHFGLSGILVEVDELISVLASLPKTGWSVELSFLDFTDWENGRRELFEKIRDMLGWRERAVAERPWLTVHENDALPLRYRCLDKAVNDFIYSDGRNPYERTPEGLDPAQRAEQYPDLAIQRYPFRDGPDGSPMETLE